MELNPPPIQQENITGNRRFPQIWVLWFNSVYRFLSGQEPIKLINASVAALPDAAINEGAIVYISDESGGAVTAFSDGVNWRRTTDRGIVS